MTSSTRILGTLSTADGKGVVRMEDRVDAGIDEVWDALTNPAKLAIWLGEFDGDLRAGGDYRARYRASGWEGARTIEAFDPPTRLVARGKDVDSSHEAIWDVALAPDGDRTLVVWEERGMPVEHLAAYGAGIQIHVEDLAAYLAGREIDHTRAGARWERLAEPYGAMPVG